MNYKGAASRYGEAFIQANGLDTKRKIEDIEKFLDLFTVELKRYLASPINSKEEKKEFLLLLSKKLDLSPLTLNFLFLIIDRNRGFYLEEILRASLEVAYLKEGVKTAYCYSAFDLDSKTKDRLKAKLEKKYDARVELHFILDPSLIGGIKLYVDSKLIDGSIKTNIENMRRQLKEGGTGGN